MISINDTHIRSLDITLLLVFEALLRRRNMSNVAAEMGLTQSAISHAVGRLRVVFDDRLFVRKGAGVEPTARALQIGPILADALSAVRAAAAVGRSFDPATAVRRFTMAAPDTVIMTIAPAILTSLETIAPRCQAVFRVFHPETAAASVATGEADIAIGVFRQRPENSFHQSVMQDSLLVASRREHPRIGAILDLETYCALGHLLVGHAPDERGMVDTALDGLGRERRVLALVPQLSLALALASQSDAVVTAPSSACRQAAALFPLTLHRPPLDLPSLEVGLLRHRDGRSDAALNWFGDQIVGALSTAATEGARIG